MAVSPLNHNVQMVTPEGKPTPEFMRWWQEFLSAVNPLAFPSGVSALFDILGTTQGAILYRSASAWALLPPGTSGRVLTTKGPSQNPSWDAVTVALANVTGFPSFAAADPGDVLTVSSDTVPVLEWAPPTGGGDASAAENKTADYTVTDTDLSGGKFHTVGKASGDIFITVPASLTNNAELTVQNDDDATVNFLADGTTINSLNDYIGVPKFGVAKLRRTAANVFALYGDLITGETPAPPAPSSVTHAVGPSDMTFSSGNLSSITDRVAASSTYISITGTLPEDATNGGYGMSEANSGAYVELNPTSLGMGVAFPSGVHLMVRTKRNATADTSMIYIGTSSGTVYAGVAASGGGSPTEQVIALTEYYENATITSTRLALWNQLMNDTNEHTCAMRNLSTTAGMRLGWYSSSGFIFEGTILGWAVFTDWAQVDDVETYLLALS